MVGETLQRLTGKCICALIKEKVSNFFQPLQLGVATRAGAEKIIHSLRSCMDENWNDANFAVFKVDMNNAFNSVSRQAVLDEVATFSQNCSHGLLGVMAHLPYCGTP